MEPRKMASTNHALRGDGAATVAAEPQVRETTLTSQVQIPHPSESRESLVDRALKDNDTSGGNDIVRGGDHAESAETGKQINGNIASYQEPRAVVEIEAALSDGLEAMRNEGLSTRNLSRSESLRLRALKGKGVAEDGETSSSPEPADFDSCFTLISEWKLTLAPEKDDCTLSPTLRNQNHSRSASRPKPSQKPALRGGAPTDAGERHVGETSNHNRDSIEDEAAFHDILENYKTYWYLKPIWSCKVPENNVNPGESEPPGLDLEDYELGDCEMILLFNALFLSGSLLYEYFRGQTSPP